MEYDLPTEQAQLAASAVARLVEKLTQNGALRGADCVELLHLGAAFAFRAEHDPAGKQFFDHWTGHVRTAAESAKHDPLPPE